ncbi:MAG: AAA domain-containing protein [Candidatus Omnitrophota bacterium]
MAIIIPSNFSKLKGDLELKNKEENLIMTLQELFNDQTICLVQVNSFPYEKAKFLACLILKDKGIILIKSMETKKTPNFKELEVDVHSLLFECSYKKLANHRQLQLTAPDGVYLKFPLKIIFYFYSLNRKDIDSNGVKKFTEENTLFDDDVDKSFDDPDKFKNRLYSGLKTVNPEFAQLSADDIQAITFQVCPEYTIPRYLCEAVQPIKVTSINPEKSLRPIEVTGDENFVKAWGMDDEQIKLVNSLLEQHELLLACAGSGKSVLLLSRAIKIAKMYPEKKILLTFYNTPLRSFYEWRLAVAGVNLRNIICTNFHQLCFQLLERNHLPTPTRRPEEDEDHFFKRVIAETRQAIEDEEIEDRFDAIFIDEIQDFDSEWYRLCYSLFKDKKKNYILCLCGDVTQDVNNRIKGSTAPWHGEGLPSFKGHAKRLRKNYRNSREINELVKNFSNLCCSWALGNLGIKINDDDFLDGVAEKITGIYPKIHQATRMEESSLVLKIVKELKEKHGVPYSDIAVLYPYKGFTGALNYHIQHWLSEKLREAGIQHSFVRDCDNFPTFYHYATRRGVTLASMGVIKGLDFQAIIICGLLPFVCRNQQSPEQLLTNMKRIYTAMTRAMTHLEVVLTNPPERDLITKFILEAYKSL